MRLLVLLRLLPASLILKCEQIEPTPAFVAN
jgi:hypothetical protein